MIPDSLPLATDLDPFELQVMECAIDGLTMRETAKATNMSFFMVQKRWESIRAKMGARSQIQAYANWLKLQKLK